jgi:hypothetical protein
METSSVITHEQRRSTSSQAGQMERKVCVSNGMSKASENDSDGGRTQRGKESGGTKVEISEEQQDQSTLEFGHFVKAMPPNAKDRGHLPKDLGKRN